MKRKTFVILLLMSMLLSACAPKASEALNYYAAGDMPASAPEQPMERQELGMDGSAYESMDTTTQSDFGTSAPVRLVIRNADLSIVVDDPGNAMKSISQMAERVGGYVVNSNLWKTNNYSGVEVPEANITVRVPADLLNQSLDEIKNLTTDRTVDVLSENISGQDVTKEYTDLNSRLKNLEEAEAKLVEILDKAEETEDVLNTFNQLTSYREQIEVTKGQIKYYEESAALSAISVRIQAHEAVNPISVAGWKPSVEISKALQALVDGMQSLLKGLIWIIIVVLPIMIVVLLPFYLIFLWIRAIVRRNKKRSIQKVTPASEE